VRDGVWRIDIEGKRDPVTGKRRRISRHVQGTREEAELALAKLRVADHEKRLPSGGTNARSVAAAFEQYLQAVESGVIELSPSTVVTVRSAAKVVGATVLADGRQFGAVRLSRLTWQDVEDLYAAMRRSGKSAAYVRRCATILARTLELARKRGLIDSNPTKDATRPRTSRTKPFAPTADQVREVLDRVEKADAEVGRAGVVFASTGMRRGELLGLQWVDVDLAQAEIHVAHAVTDGGRGVGVVRKSTKRSDWRDVPLTTGAVKAFEAQRRRRTELTGSEPGGDEYVFPAGFDGRVPMRPDDLSTRWAAGRGDSPVTILHLRHYCATRMLDGGESYRTVADILGNSESTLRLHYDGRTDVGKRKAIAALEL
jgi:integrase